MRTRALVIFGLWLAAAHPAMAARAPVVVELFTAKGCAACVKSGDVLSRLAARPHVVALTFGVDYWDYLGWPDTFARQEFDDRQKAYLKPLGLRDVYTPQLVLNGRVEAAAGGVQDVDALIKSADKPVRRAPRIAATKTKVSVGPGASPAGGGTVWLVRYDPNDQTVKVTKGENRGRAIVEHNVVRELVKLGDWNGRSKTYRLPKPTQDGLSTVVLVQGAHGGRILAAHAS
jgi:hypothetical protein